MVKILIVSDTHGQLRRFKEMLEKTGRPDRLLHLGDAEGQQEEIERLAGCPVDIVRGNCDCDFDIPQDKLIDIGKYRVFLTHGHRYQVNFGTQTLEEAARLRGADIAVYGHTHVPLIRQGKDLTVLNPGSLSLPRQDGFAYTYILMEIDREGEAHYTLCKL